MTVTYTKSNRLADYYAVGDTKLVTVRHGCHPERPFSCLTCLKNDCEHIDAVEVFIAAGGAPKEAMVAA